MVVTDAGILIELSFVLAKVNCGIAVKLSDNVTCVSGEAPKTLIPRVVTLLGKIIDVKPVVDNALSRITLTPFGILMDVNLLQE